MDHQVLVKCIHERRLTCSEVLTLWSDGHIGVA